MGIYRFKLPDIGEGIAEAEIVAWRVSVGDMVEEDTPLADLMTDKATVEMTTPVGGKVIALHGMEGDRVAIGSIFAEFEIEEAAAERLTTGIEADDAPATSELPSAREVAAAVVATPADTQPQVEARSEAPVAESAKVLASPAVRARARDLGIDLAQVATAGAHVRHADLDAFLTYNNGYRSSGKARADEQVRVVGLRRRIAENMAASKRNIPHFTYVEEFDVTKLEALRADLNETRGEKPRLTMLPLLIVAICRAVVEFPMINARFDDEAGVVTRSGAIHLGIATQTDAGLMVPVLRNAQDRNIWQLATEIARLATMARSGKAKGDELSGSTLTITSLGALGGIATTPVINRPEVAIIGPN
ncbi:MAG: dihydrolipoamide acetyltransferase family protein, partial [Janthinobacterium lividum]